MQIELSESQRSTVAVAITVVAAAVVMVAVGGVIWLLGQFVSRFSNVLLPVAVAGIAALVFQPYFDWLQTRLPSWAAILAVFLSAVLPLVGFAWFFGALVVEQVGDLAAAIPNWWDRAVEWAEVRWPEFQKVLEGENGTGLREAIEGHSEELMQGVRVVLKRALLAGASLIQAVLALLSWVVLPLYFAFFLVVDKRRIVDQFDDFLPFFKPSTRGDVIYLAREFVAILVAFFRGQLIIALIQGLLFAIGFSIVGLDYGFVIGLTLGFLNIVPYLGNIIGLLVAIPLALFQSDGGWGRLVLVLGVFTLVQMIEGYLLTPKIMGDRTGLHPMIIIFAVFFWGSALNGIAGMVLAIPLTAFLVVLWNLLREKYVAEWV